MHACPTRSVIVLDRFVGNSRRPPVAALSHLPTTQRWCNDCSLMLSTAVLTRGSFVGYVRFFATIVVVIALASAAHADDAVPAGVRAHAERRTGQLAIDGRLDEPQWQTAPRQTDFVERFPKDNSAPTFQTSFAVLYDDKAIYVGVWAHDDHPELVRALLTRRDVDAP